MTIATLVAHIVEIVQSIGYLTFGLLVAGSIILWRIHPVLGMMGVAFTLALMFGFIH